MSPQNLHVTGLVFATTKKASLNDFRIIADNNTTMGSHVPATGRNLFQTVSPEPDSLNIIIIMGC